MGLKSEKSVFLQITKPSFRISKYELKLNKIELYFFVLCYIETPQALILEEKCFELVFSVLYCLISKAK